MAILARAEFERRRNCSRCGQRLIYAQVELAGALVQRLSKRCPGYEAITLGGLMHDLLEHEHEYPARTRRGTLTRGSKRIRRAQLADTDG